jgi:hypothetical protein
MENRLLYRFIEQVQTHCRLARLAAGELRTALATLNPEQSALKLHSFLAQAHIVSRLLWPERESSVERGVTLRKELGVADEAALRLSTLRQHLTRPDECYEDWVTRLPEPNYLDFNLMAQGTLAGSPQDAFQTNLDPDTLTLTWRGDTTELAPVDEELRRLAHTTETWLRRHNPW